RSRRRKRQRPPADQLPLDARQPVPRGIGPRSRRLLQRSHRKYPRRRQIAQPMLMVNRQSLGRFARDERRTVAQLRQLTPSHGGGIVPTRPPLQDREQAKRLHSRVDRASIAVEVVIERSTSPGSALLV